MCLGCWEEEDKPFEITDAVRAWAPKFKEADPSARSAALAAVSFIQNAAFTAVSRSRNSGDVAHHAKWSVASNGVWFATQILIYSSVWEAIESGTYGLIAAAAIVYVAATTAGSCWMMAKMLKSETGKRMVGAR